MQAEKGHAVTKKKKLIVGGTTVSGLIALYFILKKFRKRSELKALTKEELVLVGEMLKSKPVERFRKKLEENLKLVSEEDRVVAAKNQARAFVNKHFSNDE